SGAAFEAASTLAETGKRSEAEAAFAKIAADGTSGYRHLARMREAAELAHTDAKAAIAAYDQIAADGAVGPALQDLAALRASVLGGRGRGASPSSMRALAKRRAGARSRSRRMIAPSATPRANFWC